MYQILEEQVSPTLHTFFQKRKYSPTHFLRSA